MAAPIVIIGAGAAGVHAALALRELGSSDEIMLLGDEDCSPYERPPLSKFGQAGGAFQPVPLVPSQSLESVDFRPGTRVAAVQPESRRIITADGTEIGYDKLLLATGAKPRRLRLANGSADAVRYLRTAEDARRIRRDIGTGARVVIIGGGLIGLEVAASARMCGADVTVIEAQSGVLKRGIPIEIAVLIAARHVAEGVNIRCGEVIDTILSAGSSHRIGLAGDDVIEADVVIAGMGSEPNTELAASAGIACDDGILANGNMLTSDPHIYAAGDCCRTTLAIYGNRPARLESWRSAQEQGRMAAIGMLGGAQTPQMPWFWTDQYDLGIQVAGLFELAANKIERRTGPDRLLVFGLVEDGTLVAAAGAGVGTAIARDIKLSEMMIAARAQPDPAMLADPDVGLKSLLTGR